MRSEAVLTVLSLLICTGNSEIYRLYRIPTSIVRGSYPDASSFGSILDLQKRGALRRPLFIVRDQYEPGLSSLLGLKKRSYDGIVQNDFQEGLGNIFNKRSDGIMREEYPQSGGLGSFLGLRKRSYDGGFVQNDFQDGLGNIFSKRSAYPRYGGGVGKIWVRSAGSAYSKPNYPRWLLQKYTRPGSSIFGKRSYNDGIVQDTNPEGFGGILGYAKRSDSQIVQPEYSGSFGSIFNKRSFDDAIVQDAYPGDWGSILNKRSGKESKIMIVDLDDELLNTLWGVKN